MKLSAEERAARNQEALGRALQSQSFANYPAIIEGFAARGIPINEIEPRVNIFTYAAWQAKGRQVRKGEKGIKIVTFAKFTKKDDDGTERAGSRPSSSTVFHISQTDPRQ